MLDRISRVGLFVSAGEHSRKRRSLDMAAGKYATSNQWTSENLQGSDLLRSEQAVVGGGATKASCISTKGRLSTSAISGSTRRLIGR